MAGLILLINAVVTWYMLGVIWVVQLGQYPLFANVGQQSFSIYYLRYTKAISYVVLIPMFTELITAGFLLRLLSGSDQWNLCVIGFILTLLIWCSTFFIQVPQHRSLERGFTDKAHRLLVRTNWIRTLLWTARSFIVALLLYTRM